MQLQTGFSLFLKKYNINDQRLYILFSISDCEEGRISNEAVRTNLIFETYSDHSDIHNVVQSDQEISDLDTSNSGTHKSDSSDSDSRNMRNPGAGAYSDGGGGKVKRRERW